MGLYSNRIFPHLMDRALSRPQVMRIRKEALAHVTGKFLIHQAHVTSCQTSRE